MPTGEPSHLPRRQFRDRHRADRLDAVIKSPEVETLAYALGTVENARSWIENGNYVLHCGNDYYMGPEGDVESS